MRVCVFVDGENLRHTIVNLFQPPLFDRREYLPETADWAKLFDALVAQATEGNGNRVRTYWYVIDQVDTQPFVIKKSQQSPQNLNDWLTRNKHLLQSSDLWDDLQSGDTNKKLERIHDSMWSHRDQIKRRFDGYHVVQNRIAFDSRAVEFRRSGRIKYNLLDKKLGKEKTVDVNLAVDMVLLKDNYDLALVVSGDQDYVPAVQAAKNSGKHVVNTAFETPSGALLPGGARRLNDVTDWSIAVPYESLKEFLGL